MVINVIFSALNVPFETIISKIKIFFIEYVAYLTVFLDTFVPKTLDRLIRRKGKRGRKKKKKTSAEKEVNEETNVSKEKITSEIVGKRISAKNKILCVFIVNWSVLFLKILELIIFDIWFGFYSSRKVLSEKKKFS
jgi:hypothetical protein